MRLRRLARSATRCCVPALAFVWPLAVHAGVNVVDDAGETVKLAAPASRVVSLAPHGTELVYAAGGAATLVGAVSYSDYPPAAKTLPRVGSNTSVDLERIAALKPDLVVAWQHGNATRALDALRGMHIPVFVSAPRRLDDVATNLERLGTLLGTAPTAQAAARRYRAEIERLRARYANRPPVTVFYEVWERPLMTLNGTQFVSDAIALCGGRNVFAQLAASVPTVTTEAVLAADPEAIVTASPGATAPPAGTPLPSLAAWRTWPQITAVARGNLFAIDGDLINRPGPRLPQGIAALCADLETARARRPNASDR